MVGVLVINMRKLSYPPIWLPFEQGYVQVAPGTPFAVGACGCRGLARGRAPADSGRFRRKWAPISPWVLNFCAVSGGSRSLSAPPTWGNSGELWCFGLIRPAKPPRSCEWDSLASEVAHLGMCFGPVGVGRRHCNHLSSKTKLANCGGRRVAHRRG